MPTVKGEGNIHGENIPVLQSVRTGNAVSRDMVYRGTDVFWIILVPKKGGQGPETLDFACAKNSISRVDIPGSMKPRKELSMEPTMRQALLMRAISREVFKGT
jgi:hypothetical protein